MLPVRPAPRWMFWAFMGALALLTPDILRPEGWSFLDGVDVLFHEAGHVLFMPFGNTLYLLGGSVFQVLLPAFLAGVFYWRGERVSAAVVLLWAAQNLGYVSVYIADARARALPLLGDDPDAHDWWQLLGGWNLLTHDLLLGRVVWLAGVATALWAVWVAYRGTEFTR
ncbi:hypothetical protein [Deinococcus ruber]|nr:hypothetical protein [Deinococcus ruber]